MTTAELIRLLQEADPEGTTPVCVGNQDVYLVQRLPAYYDGPLQQLVHDPAKVGKAWSVVGARLTASGYKVDIRPLSIRDAMEDNPDLPVDADRGLVSMVEAWRDEERALIAELARESGTAQP